MKKQTSLCGFAMLSLLASMSLYSCSSDSIEGDLNEEEVPAVAVIPDQETASVYTSEQSRVTNFVSSLTRSLTRTGDTGGGIEMPAQPSVPLDTRNLATNENLSWGANYVLPSDQSLVKKNMDFGGAIIYVQGNLTVENGWGNVTFYVLPGGTLSLPNSIPGNETKIYNYGTLNIPNAVSVPYNGALMTTGDLAVSSKLSLNGAKLYVGGNLTADEITTTGASAVHVIGNVAIAKTAAFQEATSAYLSGSITANDLTVNASTMNVACKTSVNNRFYVNGWDYIVGGVASFTSNGYLKAAQTELTDGAQIHVSGGSLADLGNLIMNQAEKTKVTVVGNSYGVVQASSIKTNMNDLRNSFEGLMGLHFESINGDDSGSKYAFRSEVKVNEEDNTVLEESACHPAFGTTPEVKEPTYVIEHVAEVTPPEDEEHSHEYSATSVAVVGDKAYVSYHTQGSEYGGCVEVMTVASEAVTLNNWIQPKDDIDFNYLTIDNNRVYATGGVKAGAFLSYIDLDSNGLFPSAITSFNKVNLKNSAEWKVNIAGAGNNLVHVGNYYIIATTSGILTLNASDLTFVGYKETVGSAKYVDVDSQNNLVTLNLLDKNTEASAAINLYSASDVKLETPTTTITGNVITPNDGKNVCRVDGNNVYVCLSQNGFKRYTNGALNGEFKLDKKNSSCNGVDFDDNYIYLAYGSYGLRILDKSTFKEVACYSYSGGKSANFVKVFNGYIYVAYGKSGLQVFKLNTL